VEKGARRFSKEFRHHSLETTEIYADVTSEELAEAVNKVWEE